MLKVWKVGTAFILFAFVASNNVAAQTAPQNILAPTGKLRAALYVGTPTSILDEKESPPRGVGYELGKALAQHLGVPFEPLIFLKNADVLFALEAGEADVAFTNASPARQKVMNFGPPFLFIELGYAVLANSRIETAFDVDQAGKRVGVVSGSTSEATLSRELKHVTLVRATTNQRGAEMLAAGEIDAFATNKATLFELADRVQGLRVLSDRWGDERHAIAYPRGREQGAGILENFTQDVLRQGIVNGAMERAGLRGARPAEPK